MKKLWLVGVGVVALVTAVAVAGEKAKEKAAAKAEKEAVAAAPAVEMTLTGTVEKIERKGKNGVVFMTWFELAGDDGVVTHLPKGKVEEYVGEKVRIVGTGEEINKKEKVTRARNDHLDREARGSGPGRQVKPRQHPLRAVAPRTCAVRGAFLSPFF